MMDYPMKAHPTLGCCGLDCGLCPRFYTAGSSKCPGCAGPEFNLKHPSCSYVTCCVKKKGLEVCGLCDEFPCKKFDSWLEDGGEYDSFVTHLKAKSNMDYIQKYGLEKFIQLQNIKIGLLDEMLENFDDGRSKSFYCLAAALLTIDVIKNSINEANSKLKLDGISSQDSKTRTKILREILNDHAKHESVELKLRKKGKN